MSIAKCFIVDVWQGSEYTYVNQTIEFNLNFSFDSLAYFASNINYSFLPIDYQFQMKKIIDPIILSILKKQTA